MKNGDWRRNRADAGHRGDRTVRGGAGDRGRRRRPGRHARAPRVPGGPPRRGQAGAAGDARRPDRVRRARQVRAHDRLLPLRQPLRHRRRPDAGDGVHQRRLGRRRDHPLAGAGAAGRLTLGDDRGAARALFPPHPASRGRRRRPAEAAEREGAAARRGRPRRADRALPRRRGSRHDRPRRRRRGRRLQPAAPGDPQHRADRHAEDHLGADLHRRAEPRRQRDRAQRPPRREQHPRRDGRLRHRRRRGRQLPHPLPPERRLGAAAQAGRLGLDPRLRRAGLHLHALRGALLPLPLPDPAARRAGPELLRERRARRDGRDDGHAAGQRGDQAGARQGRAADRPPPPLRGAQHHLHRAEGPPRSQLPDLRRERARDPESEMGQFPDYDLFCAGAGGDR